MSLVITISGQQGAGKTVLQGAIRDFLKQHGMQVRCTEEGRKVAGLESSIPECFAGKKVTINTALEG